jgi:hypothetical protein
MNFSRKIGSDIVVANADKDLEPQAGWLLSLVESLKDTEKGIKDGTRIRVGWSLIRLYRRGDELHLFEPDFDLDPFSDIRDDVSCTLKVLAVQLEFSKRLGIDSPTDWAFNDKIVLSKGCLSEEKIYLERSPTDSAGDSGWYIGPADKKDRPKQYEAIYAYQLLKLRPSLMPLLGLPYGFMAVINDKKIEVVLDPNNKNLLA